MYQLTIVYRELEAFEWLTGIYRNLYPTYAAARAAYDAIAAGVDEDHEILEWDIS